MTTSNTFNPGVRRSEIVAIYPYTDRYGELLYEVVREEPKSFKQRRPDDLAEGGYVWGLGDVTRVLYRLSDIHNKPASPVWITEGEKDADRLAALGAVATTNVGGVGMGWQDAYSRELEGRNCLVVPDRDVPGIRHGQLVVGSLLYSGAASVRMVLVSRGKDISEFFDQGGTKNELIAIVNKSRTWR